MKKLLILGILYFIMSEGFPQTKGQPSPNVLFIAIDDLNTWQGFMGHSYAQTPHMDKLAQAGTYFSNAYCQAPLCGPSRASLMSGKRPSTTGIYGQIQDVNLREAHPLLEELEFLPEYFANRGYKTMGIGKLFHQHAPEGVFELSGGRVSGFGPKPEKRFKWDQKGTSTDWGAFPKVDSLMPDFQSAEWAVDRLGEDHDRPFFLAVGFLRPHVPWYVPPKWFESYPLTQSFTPPYQENDQGDVPEIARRVAEVPMMPTTEWAKEQGEWNAICQAYLASVSFVDAQVGKVLKALESSEYADNTLIVLWSDHGYHLGEKNRFAKHSLWEPATHVPLVFAGRGILPGQTCEQPVQLLDLYPTLLELCGLPPNSQNEGTSLVPLLYNSRYFWPYPAITTYGKGNHGIRWGNYRYIRYEDGSEELYDLASDPNEWKNQALNPYFKKILRQFRGWKPSRNEAWSSMSNYSVIPYFKEQKESGR